MRGFDYNTLMRQVRKMQAQATAKQQELAEKVRCEGQAGDGRVVVTVNGLRELVSVKIDPQVVDPSDVALLEDLVTAAANAALSQANEKYEEEMSKVTGGLKIPGLTL